jgi:alpha-L-fucosidase
MPRIAAMARALQPGLIIVDRAVEGRYQNYRTPEQEVPEKALDYVWETCMTMATSWSYVRNDEYKPTSRLIPLLVDIVAKGGNLLLNIGPGPEGDLSPVALQRLKELGEWMKVNGEAIYATRAIAPYKEGNVCYTRRPDGTINAIYLAADSSGVPPATVSVPAFAPKAGSTVTMLGVTEPIVWEKTTAGCVIHVPESARANPPCRYAWTFSFNPE